jgi:hypothetical protein
MPGRPVVEAVVDVDVDVDAGEGMGFVMAAGCTDL